MKTSLVALALTLAPMPAAAQDSRPASSGKAVADALVRLRGAKQLHRLTTPRHYVMRQGGEMVLLRLTGVEVGPVLKLTLQGRSFSSLSTSSIQFEVTYELGSDGLLTAITRSELRPAKKNQPEQRHGFLGRIADGKLTGRRLRNGIPGPAFTMPWSDNNLPFYMAWFLAPSLFDQGLPTTLRPEIVLEDQFGPNGIASEPTKVLRTLLRTSATPVKNTAGALVHTFQSKEESLTITVIATGKCKGKVIEVRFKNQATFSLINAKAYGQFQRDAALVVNEGQAGDVLRVLSSTQASYKAHKGVYAKSLVPLEAWDSYLTREIARLRSSYLVLLRVSPDGSRWMAIAVPSVPGKTGKRYLVINQTGKVHASKTRLELDDRCDIPKGAKPVVGR